MEVILGLIAIVIIVVIISSYKKEIVDGQKNAVIEQKVLTATIIAGRSLTDLIELIDQVLCEFSNHLNEGIEALSIPIEPQKLEDLINDRRNYYTKMKNELQRQVQVYEKALGRHVKLFESFINEILCGETRAARYTRKRLKSRKKQVEVMKHFAGDANFLSFFLWDVSNQIGDYENHVTPLDIFKDIIAKKVKDAGLRSKAEVLITNAEADFEHWSTTREKLMNIEEESEKLEKYLSENSIWLKTFFDRKN